MRHPGTITCDFCNGPIDPSKPWTALNAVVPEDVAADYTEHCRNQAQSILGLSYVPTPTHCHVDICPSCEQAKLPDLRAIVAVLILTELEQQRSRASVAKARPRFGSES